MISVAAGRDGGSASTELVLVTPLLVALLLFVVYGGRLAHARLGVESAAHQAARAATLARSGATAETDAQSTAKVALAAEHLTCGDLRVSVDTASFRAGGSVTVTVTCRVDNTDLSGLGLPGSVDVAASASSPVDSWRGLDLDGGP